MEYAIIVIISLLVGFFLSAFIYNKFNSSVNNDTLSKNIEHLLELQKKDWDKGQSDFKGILEPLKENLTKLDKQVREIETKREGAYKSLEKELEQLGKFQLQLQETTHGLENALKSSSTRGRWGEIKLKNIIELAILAKKIFTVKGSKTTKDDIAKQFTFKNTDNYTDNPYYKMIKNSNSVSICIRQNRFSEGIRNANSEDHRKSEILTS